MHKKAMSMIATAVALGGFALAIFIPAASASKANGAYTQYCEYTEYSQYGEYCEPYTETTVDNGTTTVVTSPGFTITGGSGSSGSGSASGAPAVLVGANGVASIDVKKLTVGETFSANGVAVKVLRTTANGVEVSFGGVAVDVPSTASVSISADGTVAVTYFIAGGKLIPAIKLAQVFHPVAAVGQQVVILPKGKLSNRFSYVLTKGVSFGAKTTWKSIAKNFTVDTTAAKASKVALTVEANQARTSVAAKLAKTERSFVIKFSVGKLQYSTAEQTYIAQHKVKTLSPKFAVTVKTGEKTTKAAFGFTYPVS